MRRMAEPCAHALEPGSARWHDANGHAMLAPTAASHKHLMLQTKALLRCLHEHKRAPHEPPED
eukprot:10353221-Prorocentrum_lima.AAC.1